MFIGGQPQEILCRVAYGGAMIALPPESMEKPAEDSCIELC